MENLLPRVSVIILTKNGGEKFSLVLKTIFNSSVNFNYEVIVVDSGSTDGTVEMLSSYPVRLIEIPPADFSHGGARNLGARNAKGEFLVFLTQDAVPKGGDWLPELLKNFYDDNVAGVYGKQIPEDSASPYENFFLNYMYPDFRIVKNSLNLGDCVLQDFFFSNVNSAIRKSDWEKFKFNETLIMSEDQEWSRRILMNGKKIVYEPKAVVVHSHKYTVFRLIGRNFDSGMSLKGLIRAPFKRGIRYEAAYLKAGMIFFLNSKAYGCLLMFPFYEGIRMLGFLFGFYSGILPLKVKIFLSQNKTYWKP